MAGFIYKQNVGDEALDYAGELEFHMDDEDLVQKLKDFAGDRRVVTIQLDGDELDAFWRAFKDYTDRLRGRIQWNL